MTGAARPTVAQLQAWYETDLERARQLEMTEAFVACQCSFGLAVTRAHRAQAFAGVVEIRQGQDGWQAFSGQQGFGRIVHPHLLPEVLAFASCSGWLVQPVPLPWWRRLLDNPRWRVEVPFDLPTPTLSFPEIAPAIRARVLRSA